MRTLILVYNEDCFEVKLRYIWNWRSAATIFRCCGLEVSVESELLFDGSSNLWQEYCALCECFNSFETLWREFCRIGIYSFRERTCHIFVDSANRG